MGDVPSKEQNRGGGDHSVSQAEIQRLRQQVAQLQRQQQQQQQQAGRMVVPQEMWTQVQRVMPVLEALSRQQMPTTQVTQAQWQQFEMLRPHLQALQHHGPTGPGVVTTTRTTLHTDVLQSAPHPNFTPHYTGAVPKRGGGITQGQYHANKSHETGKPEYTKSDGDRGRGGRGRGGGGRGRGNKPHEQGKAEKPGDQNSGRGRGEGRGGGRGRGNKPHEPGKFEQQGDKKQNEGKSRGEGRGRARSRSQPRHNSGALSVKDNFEHVFDHRQPNMHLHNEHGRVFSKESTYCQGKGMQQQHIPPLLGAGKEQVQQTVPPLLGAKDFLESLKIPLKAQQNNSPQPTITLQQLQQALLNLTENAPEKPPPEKKASNQNKKINNSEQQEATSEQNNKKEGADQNKQPNKRHKKKNKPNKPDNLISNDLLGSYDTLDDCTDYFDKKVQNALNMAPKKPPSVEECDEPLHEDIAVVHARFMEIPQEEVRSTLPVHWVLRGFPMLNNYVTPELDPNSMDFVELSNLFSKTAPTLKVRAILRVENAFLWHQFCAKKRELAQILGGEPEELQLFHGPRDLEAVLEYGFGWSYTHRPRPRRFNHRIALTTYAANACQHCQATHKVVVATSLQASRDPSKVDLLTEDLDAVRSVNSPAVVRLLDDFSSYPSYVIQWEGELPPPASKQAEAKKSQQQQQQ